ncbi:unnamed protein product [Amoebophrya sp. A120]|nr:unnamed protein product [Amoebophrya sp. A120]|eukprot:GSA120T00000559001.1
MNNGGIEGEDDKNADEQKNPRRPLEQKQIVLCRFIQHAAEVKTTWLHKDKKDQEINADRSNSASNLFCGVKKKWYQKELELQREIEKVEAMKKTGSTTEVDALPKKPEETQQEPEAPPGDAQQPQAPPGEAQQQQQPEFQQQETTHQVQAPPSIAAGPDVEEKYFSHASTTTSKNEDKNSAQQQDGSQSNPLTLTNLELSPEECLFHFGIWEPVYTIPVHKLSGTKVCTEDFQERLGGDIEALPQAKSAEECRLFCQDQVALCDAWSYNTAPYFGTMQRPSCYAKFSGMIEGDPAPLENVTGGTCRTPLTTELKGACCRGQALQKLKWSGAATGQLAGTSEMNAGLQEQQVPGPPTRQIVVSPLAPEHDGTTSSLVAHHRACGDRGWQVGEKEDALVPAISWSFHAKASTELVRLTSSSTVRLPDKKEEPCSNSASPG